MPLVLKKKHAWQVMSNDMFGYDELLSKQTAALQRTTIRHSGGYDGHYHAESFQCIIVIEHIFLKLKL
ncbi:Uncharacterised protein [Legionella lansingensis]|uniref:Uncharacterized protein n=1 Tax=Legionella lansingensis TaxID=45067 RepID=A0A0W0VFA0_9GAMM|nr:hypothetical protein [Legionella lansingensis]KTD18573.1 hypothetical protein Llan_2491 [Legionella lansingensis]SNV49366.1 Uncharacterised protein [Legionella lansingensis]